MSYDMSRDNRVDAGRPEKFKGKCTVAGFVEGFIAETNTVTKQLFLLWKPNDEDMNAQPAWYSMGQREFEFGGEEEEHEIGTKVQTLYEKIVDGDQITKTSWVGLLFDRFDELGFEVKGSSARQFIGVEADLEREDYPQKGKKLDNVGDNIMPVKIIGAKKSGGKDEPAAGDGDTVDESEIDDIIIAAIDGKTDKDIPAILKEPRMKATGLKAPKVFKRLDALVESGRLTKDGDKYEEA